MAQQIINAGVVANDGQGDSLRSGATKINNNFTELYSQIGVLASQAIIPNQSGNGGKFLTTSGSVLSWATVSGGVGGSTYTLPTATTTELGGVKVDGTTVTITNQVISVGSILYNKISNPPAIPTLVSQLTNDSAFLTTVAWTGVTGKPTFATVATSGSYTDLINKPTLFSGSYTDLTSKPTLFSGSYTDLTDKPSSYTLPTASTTVTGGIKIDGNTLAFNGSGQLYFTGAGVGGYTLPTATTSQLGGVKVDGTSITINVSGVIGVSNGVYTTDTGTVTNAMLAGSIANAKLANSTISGKALGTNLDTLTIGTGLSGTSYNGSTAVTISLAANYGDTQNPFASKTAKFVLAAPTGIAGVPTFRELDAADIPTLNQNTTGSAGKSTNLVGGNSSTLLGSIPYQSNTDVTTLLSPNTTATKKFLTQTGNGTNGAAPSWGTISASDIPNATTSAVGGVIVGTGLSVSSGTVSVTTPLPAAAIFSGILTTNGSGTTEWSTLTAVGTSLSSYITAPTPTQLPNWTAKTSAYTAIAGDQLLVDTSAGTVTITLPASPAIGNQIAFLDAKGTWGTYVLTINPNGKSIMGVSTNTVMGTNKAGFTLVYNGSNDWRVF